MATNIGPKIGIDGEAEFRKQLNLINTQLTTLGTEMKKVSSEFSDNSRSQDALVAKNKVLTSSIEKQEKQLEEVSKALESAKDKYGENSIETQKWQQVVNRSETQLSSFKNELKQNEKELDEMKRGLRSVDGSLSDMGDAAKEAGDKGSNAFDDFKNMIGEAKGALLGGGIALGLGKIKDAIASVVEETREYRKIMGSLEISSDAAGYSAEETKETYMQLYGVLGDDQTAATTTANLQALGLEQKQLSDVTYAAIGAWSRYGDSIPIDGLAESINETVKAGQVTGGFADVLNWAGTNEDKFNEKLAAAKTETERTNIVLEELSKQGLTEAGKSWEKNNKSLAEGQRANAEYQEALAHIGETLEPLNTAITEIFTGLLEAVGDFFDFLMENKEVTIPIIVAIGTALLTWGVASMIQGVISVMGPLTTAIKGVNAAMSANPIALIITLIASVVAALVTLWNTNEDFRNAVIEIWGKIKEVISGAVEAVIEFFTGLWDKIKEIWNNIKTFISDTVTGIKNKVVSVFQNIVNGVKEKVTNIKNSIVDGFNKAIDFIKSLPKKAIQWGKDFIDGLKKGITSKIGEIADGVKGVAGKIKNFLHFSRPDEGPLRDYEKWMPDFMKGLAKGIKGNENVVIDAAKNLAANLSKAMDMTNNVAYTSENENVINLNTNLTLDGKIIGRVAEQYISSKQRSIQRMKGAF